jgi:TPR repeat protein
LRHKRRALVEKERGEGDFARGSAALSGGSGLADGIGLLDMVAGRFAGISIAAGKGLAGLAMVLFLAAAPAEALDGSTTPSGQKITPGRTFKSAREALRAGVDDLQAGDAQSSVQALTYAAEGGETLAQWKLGSIYAAGEVVPRNDALAYKYFEQLVDNYDEEETDQRSLTAIANAFVQVGLYNLSGIAGSAVKPDPERAVEMFEIAATRFGDADGEYHLARMFIDGAGGLERDKLRAAKWLGLAAEKGHRAAQALLGHMLFRGDGVPRQAARGLMWLSIGAAGANAAKDSWIRDLQSKDVVVASDNERNAAAAFLAARGKREIAAALTAPAHSSASTSASAAPPLQLTGAAAPAP